MFIKPSSKLLLIFLMVAISLAVFAQNSVTVFGKVVDIKTGEPLIGATVSIEGTSLGTTTDLDGNFSLNDVTPASYNFIASYLGYKAVTKDNVIIQSMGNIDLIFQLEEASTELKEVEVTASPFRNSTTTPMSIQSLSPAEIKSYPGGNNDIAKVVQSLPGVSGSVGGFRNDIIIRGGAPNENIYYLDGIEIPNINHFSTQGSAGGPVGLLNVNFVDGVTLAASSFGAQYDNVLSGVLQFDQRKGNERNAQTNFRISASEAALTTEGPLFKGGKDKAKTTYIVSARRSYLQFLFQLLQLPIRPDYWDYQYKINHELNDRNTLYLTGIGSIDQYKVKAPDEFDVDQIATLEQVPIIDQWSTTSGIGWKNRMKDGKGVMNASFGINMLNNAFRRYSDNENQTGLIFNNDSRESERRLRYSITRFVDKWSLSAGANVVWASYKNQTENLLFDNRYVTELGFWKYGLFAQASKSLFNGRLDFSFGLRTDGNSLTSGDNLATTLSPRMSLSYSLDQEGSWRLNATAGRYFKLPPYTILGFQNSVLGFTNQDVRYIASNHGVLGLEKRLGKNAKISVETFYKYYQNYPVSVSDMVSLANKGGDFSVLGNEEVESTGLGKTWGTEFLYQQKLVKNFYGILAVTLFRSEFTGTDGVFRPSAWDSRSLVSFTGGYKAKRNFEINLRYRYAGKTPYAGVDQDATLNAYPIIIIDYNTLATNRLDAFSQLDFRVDKKWNFKNLSFNLYLEIQNAFGETLPSPPSYGLKRDQNGQVISPKQLIEIPDNSGTLLPIIGMAFDF